MKRSLIALSLIAVLGVAACGSHAGSWTPQDAGRTAGKGTVEYTKGSKKADKAFSQSLRK